MPTISDTIARLAAMSGAKANDGRAGKPLTAMEDFGSNPGALRARLYIPEQRTAPSPLVVVLHGCTQTADAYAVQSGWSQLADRYGFVLLCPEQQRQNNANLCFDWFAPEDMRRDHGEALSIRQMIAAMIETYGIDPARVFVTGLSAGGAMASVMLAAYPELFAGGAIIAGLPYGCAATMPQAFDRMRGRGMPDEAQLSASVRGASPHQGSWPRVSVWHGSADATVSPANAAAIVGQWRTLHGLAATPTHVETVAGYPRHVWCDGSGNEVIEEYSVTGMSHGMPLATSGAGGCGASGAFMLDVGISAADHICRFWKLTQPGSAHGQAPASTGGRPTSRIEKVDLADVRPSTTPRAAATEVGKVIEAALRAAGLMR